VRVTRPPAAIVLAGGLGTRLAASVPGVPKVLAPVAGRPFLEYLLAQLARAGVRDVVLATGHGAELVEAAAGDGGRWGLAVRASREASPLGTGGAIALARHSIPADARTVLVVNGDSFADMDLAAFARSHEESGAPASLLLVEVEDAARYGAVAVDEHGAIAAFGEKERTGPGLVNAGVYAFSRAVLERLPTGRPASLEREVLPSLIGRGLRGEIVSAPFIDIGTPESYQQAQRFFTGHTGLDVAGRLVLIDRDGTLTTERGYVTDPADLELLPGAAGAVKRLCALGLKVVLISNQSAIGRGLMTDEALEHVNTRLAELLAAEGTALDGVYLCTHAPADACACRKPGTALLERAAADHQSSLTRSFVVGDNVTDIDAGRAVGALTILVTTGHGREMLERADPDRVVADLPAAAAVIEQVVRWLS
jgi:D-glycero-alpha-D-manno-heptose 1-phosphate guanylyltransferase